MKFNSESTLPQHIVVKFNHGHYFPFPHWKGDVLWAVHRWGGLSTPGSLACPGCHGDTQHSHSQPMLLSSCAWHMGRVSQWGPCAWAPVSRIGPISSGLIFSPTSQGLLLSPGAPQVSQTSVHSKDSSLQYFRGTPPSSPPSSKYPAQSIQHIWLWRKTNQKNHKTSNSCFPPCKKSLKQRNANAVSTYLKRQRRGKFGKQNPN